MGKQLVHSEYYFQKKTKEDTWVGLTVYIMYDTEKFQIVQEGEESVFFGKRGSIAENIAYAELCKEAMTFIESELKIKAE